MGDGERKTKRFCLDEEEDDTTSDSDDEEKGRKSKKNKRSLKDDEFEEVPIDHRNASTCSFSPILLPCFLAMKRVHLDAEGLAIGHVMAQSRQGREQVIDKSYNR